jgi:hypothetical protein
MPVSPNNYSASGTGEFLGKDLEFYIVDYVAAVNGSDAKDEVQDQVRKVLAQYGTIVAIGPLVDSNTQQVFAFEGRPGAGGSSNNTSAEMAAVMQVAIRALGTVDGITLSGNATVTATGLGILTAAAV